MEVTGIVESLLCASADALSSEEIARLIRARVAEAEDQINAENEKIEDESAEKQVLSSELVALQDIQAETIQKVIETLNTFYEEQNRSFRILERSKGWKIYTTSTYADFVRQLFPGQKPQRLSAPAMETLAIIAYRQPITKSAMEAVRGVSCDGMLQKLLDRELVRIAGRADLPGRPLLYETTDLFFEHFGIKSVDDLPNSTELRRVPLPEAKEETENTEDGAEASEETQENAANAENVEKQLALSATTTSQQSQVAETEDSQSSEDSSASE